jgi:hypothetical protein
MPGHLSFGQNDVTVRAPANDEVVRVNGPSLARKLTFTDNEHRIFIHSGLPALDLPFTWVDRL